MAHHNFYDSLGLDRGKDAETLGKVIDERLNSQSLNDATRDELQVARRILGDPGRRKIYDTRLDDPTAPTIDVPALRQMAAADPGSAGASNSNAAPSQSSQSAQSSQPAQSAQASSQAASAAPGTNSAATPKRKKPKQYFPDTNPNAEAVRPGQAVPGATSAQGTQNTPGAAPNWNSFPTTTSIPVYQGPNTGSFPGQYGFQSQSQPQYGYPGQQGQAQDQAQNQQGQAAQLTQQAQTAEPAQVTQSEPQPAQSGATAAEKKGASPWLVGAIVLVLLAIAAGGWWLWSNSGEAWDAKEQEMADTFPQIISEQSGQKGWLGMKCTSMTPNSGEDARIRCSDKKLGVSVIDYGTEANRDQQLPEGDAEVIGNNVCSARSYKMDGVTPPAYRIAPEGDDAQYLLVVNGGEAESKRMYLNLCEKTRG